MFQVELHPLLAQRKLVGVSYRKGVISVAHTCLARQAPELLQHPVVLQVAAETGKTPSQVSDAVGRQHVWWIVNGYSRLPTSAVDGRVAAVAHCFAIALCWTT